MQNQCRQAAVERGALGEHCYEFAVDRFYQANLSAGGGVSVDLINALYRTCLGQ